MNQLKNSPLNFKSIPQKRKNKKISIFGIKGKNENFKDDNIKNKKKLKYLLYNKIF